MKKTSCHSPKSLNGAFPLLCAAGGFAIFSSTMSKTPVLPLFANDLGATPKLIGLIAAAATVAGIVTSAPAGILSDKFGRRKILLLSGAVFASAPFLYFWVRSPGQLAVLRIYHGFATAIFGPVALASAANKSIVQKQLKAIFDYRCAFVAQQFGTIPDMIE